MKKRLRPRTSHAGNNQRSESNVIVTDSKDVVNNARYCPRPDIHRRIPHGMLCGGCGRAAFDTNPVRQRVRSLLKVCRELVTTSPLMAVVNADSKIMDMHFARIRGDTYQTIADAYDYRDRSGPRKALQRNPIGKVWARLQRNQWVLRQPTARLIKPAAATAMAITKPRLTPRQIPAGNTRLLRMLELKHSLMEQINRVSPARTPASFRPRFYGARLLDLTDYAIGKWNAITRPPRDYALDPPF